MRLKVNLSGLIMLLLLSIAVKVSAFDFEVNGIFYGKFCDSETDVYVTYEDSQKAYEDEFVKTYKGDIVIPETVEYDGKTYKVTSIGNRAFRHCDELKSVTFGTSITKIEDRAFQSCTGLEEVNMGNNLEIIEERAFYNCTNLKKIILPESLKYISIEAFQRCNGIQEIDIPNSVEIIYKGAFLQCSNLSTITIGKSIEVIGKEAFAECPIKEIFIYANTPPDASLNPFKSTEEELNYNQCVLHVDKSAVERYKSAPIWENFYNIVGIATDQYTEIELKDSCEDAVLYDLNGMKVHDTTKNGVYIIVKNNKAFKEYKKN